ncbi:hypothetical protein [Nonomuraea salmonea]|uniref:hypothetical protein n=1 Tax=Nonomuraea salmonea TaxID=46181 RepID=UPI0031EA472B
MPPPSASTCTPCCAAANNCDEGLGELRRGRAAVITGTADAFRPRLVAAAEEYVRTAL